MKLREIQSYKLNKTRNNRLISLGLNKIVSSDNKFKNFSTKLKTSNIIRDKFSGLQNLDTIETLFNLDDTLKSERSMATLTPIISQFSKRDSLAVCNYRPLTTRNNNEKLINTSNKNSTCLTTSVSNNSLSYTRLLSGKSAKTQFRETGKRLSQAKKSNLFASSLKKQTNNVN